MGSLLFFYLDVYSHGGGDMESLCASQIRNLPSGVTDEGFEMLYACTLLAMFRWVGIGYWMLLERGRGRIEVLCHFLVEMSCS